MGNFLTVCSKFKKGPLGILNRISEIMQDRFNGIPECRRLILLFNNLLWKIHNYLDSSFDKKYGTSTTGVIWFDNLKSENENISFATRYEPTSVKVFKQIMKDLNISFGQFEFVDFGSGKGRTLILASECGFKKIKGVEFLPELHRIATKNIAIYEHCIGRESGIETICMDATKFPIPEAPLFIYFFSPFKGKVLEKVLSNIAASLANKPREFVLLFYGNNPESIELFKAVKFQPKIQSRELHLRADWSHFMEYRCLFFLNVKGVI